MSTTLQVIEVQNVRGYVDEKGTVWLNAEDVARGLGFIDVKNSVEYIRWRRVNEYLHEFGFSPDVAKDSFIPENIFYLLAMKASNETAKQFQLKIANEILPSIRKTGFYAIKPMSAVEVLLMTAKAIEEQQRQLQQQEGRLVKVEDAVSSLTENVNDAQQTATVALAATEEISQRLDREIQSASTYDIMLDVDHAKTKEKVRDLEDKVLDIKDQLVDITSLPKTMWPDIKGCVGAVIQNLEKYQGLSERQARQQATEDLLGDISVEAGHTRGYISQERNRRRNALIRQGVSETSAKKRITCNTVIDTDPALKIAAAKVIQSYNRTIATLDRRLIL